MNRWILIILVCLIILTGCNNKKDQEIEQEKLLTEVEYLGSKVISMLNKLNDISLDNYEIVSKNVSTKDDSENSNSNKSSSDSNSSGKEENKESDVVVTEMKYKTILNANIDEIDWDSMKKDIENINTSWSVTMIDLYSSGVPETELKAFEEELNNAIIGIKNEEKPATILSMCNLYSYIPEFLKYIRENDVKIDIELTKYHILNAYVSASLNDWKEAEIKLQDAEISFLNVISKSDEEYKNSKIYLLIKDLQDVVKTEDQELFFLKYKNLMQNMGTIQFT